MTTAMTTFGQAGLPTADALAAALRNVQNEVQSGSALLKLDKTGHWSFGIEATEPEPGSRWAVNPFSFVHGYVAWGDGEILAEKIVAIQSALPDLETAPAGAKKGWELQVGFMVRCMTGADVGTECRYLTASSGGKQAFLGLSKEVADHIGVDPEHPVPLVELHAESYRHRKYGMVFNPVFKIVDWTAMDGTAASKPALPEAATEDVQPERRRRRDVAPF